MTVLCTLFISFLQTMWSSIHHARKEVALSGVTIQKYHEMFFETCYFTRPSFSSLFAQGISGRVNAYCSYNAAIDAAADALEAEAEAREAPPVAVPAASDDDRGNSGPQLRLPPIEGTTGAGDRPTSAT